MFSLARATALGRLGIITTAHGAIDTPCFLPVASTGAMKGVSFQDLRQLGAQALLCNAYHLHITPGERTIETAGGLHAFTGWDKPILTDSGGFQVFSLSKIRTIDDHGVRFRNYRNGAEIFLGPEESMRIQHALRADIIMCFDECPPSTAPRAAQIAAVDRTLKWAKACKEVHERLKAERAGKAKKAGTSDPSLSSCSHVAPLLFGIVQGGLERDLRQKCAEELIGIGFDGYAIGGLAVGESEGEMLSVVDFVCPHLPADKPRYLMGVGDTAQQRQAVARGIDLFDSVAPMREARHGNIWLSDGSKLRIRRSEFASDHAPIDRDSPAPTSRTHTRSYLHHLMQIGERSGETLACLQNMAVTLEGMRKVRETIEQSIEERP